MTFQVAVKFGILSNCVWLFFIIIFSSHAVFLPTSFRKKVIKHETSTQCWSNVGPPSTTLAQHWFNIGWMSRVRCS